MGKEKRFPLTGIIEKMGFPVFGVAGTHIMRILGDFSSKTGKVEYISARTELCAGFMSVGYSRTHGSASICLLTPGPGFLVGTAAMLEAGMKGSPVIFISGQIHEEVRGKGGKALHEFENQLETARGILKNACFASTGEEADRIFLEAVRRGMGTPPSPFYIEVPQEAMIPYNVDFPIEIPSPDNGPTHSRETHDEIWKTLEKSKHPVIFAGLGTLSAESRGSLSSFSEAIGAPVVTSISGKGAIPEESPHSGGVYRDGVGGKLLRDCDLLIGLGTGYTFLSTGNRKCPLPSRLIHVNPEGHPPSPEGVEVIHFPGRVESFLTSFENIKSVDNGKWREAPFELVRETRKKAEDAFPREMEYIQVMEESIPRDGWIFTDPTIISYWMRYFFRVNGCGHYLYPSGSNSLGFALSAAIGSLTNTSERRAFVITGDGNFPYCAMELGTAVERNSPITLILFNDGGYGVLREWRKWGSQDRVGVDLLNPDYRNICEGYGIEYNRVRSPVELAANIDRTEGDNGIRFLEVEETLLAPWPIL
jgi:acetolactate synthase-1/2/3 large subunit